ncbi:hypothetical protein [Mycobacterium riyadhense]|uniref:hypothetical protein n=1 Tax=Mycobacterium riyadhense TaxID=486698 RepID=UPI00195655C3|nr:hypothetical protein [Mycobacterium riyadhense]
MVTPAGPPAQDYPTPGRPYRTPLLVYLNGAQQYTAAGLRLMTGVEITELKALQGVAVMPDDLRRQIFRRTQEGRAHSGRADELGVFVYWAQIEYGARVEVDILGTIWMVGR